MKPPLNDLERAYVAIRGPESYPAVLRLMLESTLIFLVPYHPEFEDATIKLKEGDRLPTFSLFKGKGKDIRVPIFTSIERANAACKRMKMGPRECMLMSMRGQELFNILTLQPHPIAINPMTGYHTMFFGLPELKGLADGSLFRPLPGTQRKSTVNIVQPADYPTDFLQPLFCFLRECPQVKAVWLFREATPLPPFEVSYVFVFKAEGDTARLKEDFYAAARIALPPKTTFHINFFDEKNAAIARLTAHYPAFYAAPDYKAPSPLGE